MQEIVKNEIDITNFPPLLRKLARFMIENTEFDTIQDACEQLGLSSNAVYVAIHKRKKKGIDFMNYVADNWKEGLDKAKPLVRNALVREAITGTAMDRKLYFQLTGDLTNKLEVDHKITGLFAVISPSNNQLPEDIQEHRKKVKPFGVQIVDIEYED